MIMRTLNSYSRVQHRDSPLFQKERQDIGERYFRNYLIESIRKEEYLSTSLFCTQKRGEVI